MFKILNIWLEGNAFIGQMYNLDLHLGVISLGWAGTYSKYEYGTVSTSALDVRKGGVDGLIQGFRDYGIGITKKF